MFDLLLWPFRLLGSLIGLAFDLVAGLCHLLFGLVGTVFGLLFGGGFFILTVIGAVALVRWVVRGVRGA